MARYVLPTFNLDVGIWRHGTSPPGPPALHTDGNMSPGEITGVGALEVMPLMSAAQCPMFLRMPPGTDIRDGKAVAGADNVEVPFGSGRYYDVAFVDDVALGFANEHRFAVLLGRTPWATPFPGGSPGPPPPPAGFTFVGQGVDALAALNSWNFSDLGATNPGEEIWFATAQINQSGPSNPIITDGVTIATNVQHTTAIIGGGVSCELVLSRMRKGAGGPIYTTTLTGGATARFSFQAFRSVPGWDTFDRNNQVIAATPTPSVTALLAPTSVPTLQSAAFFTINPAIVPASAGSFTVPWGPVINNIGGTPTYLLLTALVQLVMGIPTANLNTCTPVAWGAALSNNVLP